MKDKLVLEIIKKHDIKIYQDPKLFKFGIDAFCLAEFTEKYIRNKEKYMDICSGSGIVGIITSKINNIKKPYFVEINPYFCMINALNLKENYMDGEVINEDLCNLDEKFERESFDFITINPPYMKINHGLKTRDKFIDLAKIEKDEGFLENVFRKAFYLLKDKGQLFMVHRVERLVDIFYLSRAYKMEAKSIQYIRNRGAKKSSIVLIRFVKNGNKFLENLNDLII